MDIELSYIEKGKGMPLILLHGNGESNEYFVNQIDYFSDSFRVIAVDTRGHGKSPRGEKPFTISQFADDLKDFLDSLGIEKAVILGFSDGANIAVAFALKYQNYVEKLILNGGNLNPGGVKGIYQIPICISYYIVSFISLFDKKAVRKKEMLGLMVNQPDFKENELSEIHVPTLVIAGTNDMIKEEHTISIHKAIKNSRLCLLEGDHFIALKNSLEFNEKVKAFLLN